MQYLIVEKSSTNVGVLATNVPTITESTLSYSRVQALADTGVSVTLISPELIRDGRNEITPETQSWLQRLLSSSSSASYLEQLVPEESLPKKEKETASFDAGTVDNFLSSINRKRGNQ